MPFLAFATSQLEKQRMAIKQFVVAVALVGSSVLAAPSQDISASITLNLTGAQALADRPTRFWYSNIDHNTRPVRGFAPDLDGDVDYAVFKAVKPGDGASIQAAINSGTNGAKRHGLWFASQPRVSDGSHLGTKMRKC